MGMFSWVEVHESLLPEKYRKIKDWQTKDVVEPIGATLVINGCGKLLYRWYGVLLDSNEKLLDVLDYTGRMYLYAFATPFSSLITLVAEFVDGKLISINKEDE